MKTYMDSHNKLILTSKDIEEAGINALSRALNIGRVIAFTASGSTVEYGRPSWGALVDFFISKAVEEKSKNSSTSENSSRGFDDLYEDFKEIFGDSKGKLNYSDISGDLKRNPAFVISFLAMCERLASWEGDARSEDRAVELREHISKFLSNNILPEFIDKSPQKNIYQGVSKDILEKAILDEKTVLNEKTVRGVLGEADNEVLKKAFFRQAYNSSGIIRTNSDVLIVSGLLLGKKFLGLSEEVCKKCIALLKASDIDPLATIYEELNIRRYLTLNYDVEIEKLLAKYFANRKDSSHKEFCEFIAGPISNKPVVRERELKNGLQQAIRTSTISEDNLGDLFTFGAFPSNFQSSVFHLHGRVDDPENMIITQLDYERLYLKSTLQRRSFEEARHAVFNGSDIIFIGCGMNEADVLAPLRDFTAQHRQLDEVPGRVYALLLSNTSKSYRSENIGFAQTLYKHYGVYAIFIDGGESGEENIIRKLRCFFSDLLSMLRDVKNRLSNNGLKKNHLDEIESMAREINRAVESSALDKKLPEYKIIQDVLGVFVEKYLSWKDFCLNINELSENERNEWDETALNLLLHLLECLQSRLCSHALQKKLVELNKERLLWWQKQQKLPRYRLTIYGGLAHNTELPLVWSRQKNEYLYKNFQLNELMDGNGSLFAKYCKHLQKVKAECPSGPVRIKRFNMAAGSGKGGLVSFLQHKMQDKDGPYYPFEHIFSNAEGKVDYCGAFFSHLTFTLEFSSTIFSLVRFIAKAAKLEDTVEVLRPENVKGYQRDRKTGIFLLKVALKELKYKGLKIFVCFSGIDRLSDRNGDAFSPVHREFFRVISGFQEEIKLRNNSVDPKPIDLLLIATENNYPIRYLSNEFKSKKAKKNFIKFYGGNEKRFSFRKDRKIWLEKWNDIAAPGFSDVLSMTNYAAIKSIEKLNMSFAIADFPSDSEIVEVLDGRRSEPGDNVRKFIATQIIYTSLFVRLLHWKHIMRGVFPERFADAVSEDNKMINAFNVAIDIDGGHGFIRQIFIEMRKLTVLSFNESINSPGKFDCFFATPVNIKDVIMRHLTLFDYPVQACVLLNCPDIKLRLDKIVEDDKVVNVIYGGEKEEEKREEKEKEEIKRNILTNALSQLLIQGLVIRINSHNRPYDGEGEIINAENSINNRYILHRDIAAVVAKDMSYITQYSLSTAPYQISFYCAQSQSRLGVPQIEHFEFVSKILDKSFERIDNEWNCNEISIDANENLKKSYQNVLMAFYESSAILRSNYAMLRGSFSIGAISRIENTEELRNQPYEIYSSWVRGIINCSVKLSVYQGEIKKKFYLDIKTEYQQKYRERHETGLFDESEGIDEFFDAKFNLPFYRDEVAWLYNEQGVVSFMQGKMFDAISLYYQSLTVLKLKQEPNEDQSAIAPGRRVKVNLAIAKIERGEIHSAIEILENVISEIKLGKHSTPSLTLIYAKGYRALCNHLTGNFTQAEIAYREVIEQVLTTHQLRAASIFQRHLADLLRIREQMGEAKDLLLLSERAASQAQQEDVLHYTLLARARLMRDMKSRSEALSILRRTENYAKRMGLQKMLAETLKVRAEVMLAEGEVTQAGKMSAQAVAIFKRNGMRLRKISSALLHANVYAKRGQLSFAEKILNEIDQEASELGYTLKSGDAHRLRQTLIH